MAHSRTPAPPAFARGEKHRVKIEGLGSYGEGLARHQGNEIFVPKAAPGDEVLVEILEQKKGRYRAQIVEFYQPSSARIDPRCRHFQNCGGCDFQHLSYSDQMAWKLRMTKHWIRRSPLAPGLDSIEFQTLESPNPYHYRHRVRLQFRDRKLHFFKPHSNDLLLIEECPILRQGFFEKLQEIAKNSPDTRDSTHTLMNGDLVTDQGSYEMDGHEIRFSSECFTQANLEVNQNIWTSIKEEVESLSSKVHALDLYCGIGNFTLPLKDHFQKVTGVEYESAAIEMAKKNSNEIRWIAGGAEHVMKDFESKREFFDFVLLDPPRAGARPCIEILARILPEKIVYVSCSLDSLIPDLVHLVKKSRYSISKWVVADMFPQTHHIESVVTLNRRL